MTAPGRPGAAEVDALLVAVLTERGADFERLPAGGVVVTLPGEHKQKTLCSLVPGDHALRVEAFVMRHPDEDADRLHRYLLTRNARMYGVAFTVDALGDVYLVGRVALHSVDADEVDRLLGSVLRYADDSFDEMLAIGFRTSIRREWAWRVSRGESLANLAAFASWAGRAEMDGPPGPGR